MDYKTSFYNPRDYVIHNSIWFHHNMNVKELFFFSERELKKALRDTLTWAAWLDSYPKWQISQIARLATIVVKFNTPLFRDFYNPLSNYTKTIIRLRLVNISDYNPPINFRAISLATLHHVLDSYHAITPLRFHICPPPLISTEKSKDCRKKASTRVSIFIFIIIHGRKTTFFVESSDSDIRKLIGMLFQRLQRRQKHTNQKASAIKRQVFWGTAKV